MLASRQLTSRSSEATPSLPDWLAEWPELEALRDELPGAEAVRVAILDGPVDRRHAAFVGRSLSLLPAIASNDLRQARAAAHGAAVASIVLGIAPGCTGLIIPILEEEPSAGRIGCSQLHLARGIELAAEAGAHVINVSAGELSSAGAAHPLLADAVRTAAARGALIVAAAGNDGCECLHVPAGLPGVLAIGAADENGAPLPSSNWGAAYRTSGLLVRGDGLPAAAPGGGFSRRSGTSFACAAASGVIALLLSAQLRRGQAPDPLQLRSILLRSASPCDGGREACGPVLAGRLNIVEALREMTAMSTSLAQQPQISPAEATEPPADEPQPEASAGAGVAAAECACGCPPAEAPESAPASPVNRLVYALGTIGYDFGAEARRDSIAQQMAAVAGGAAAPHDPEQLLAYLEKNPYDAQSVHWTLNIEATPIYVVQPSGPFAAAGYERLREFLRDQTAGRIERVSVPGVIVGRARLASGQTLPVIWPELRGMYSWNTAALVRAVRPQSRRREGATEAEGSDVTGFLERVYHGLRNLGFSAADRAVNYAATNALNAAQVFEAAVKDGMQLDDIAVERSALCRPESECWDVKLYFFDPERQLQRARRVYRFTVDVSDVCPVMVGQVRSWSVR